jgi:hypothetical protein
VRVADVVRDGAVLRPPRLVAAGADAADGVLGEGVEAGLPELVAPAALRARQVAGHEPARGTRVGGRVVELVEPLGRIRGEDRQDGRERDRRGGRDARRPRHGEALERAVGGEPQQPGGGARQQDRHEDLAALPGRPRGVHEPVDELVARVGHDDRYARCRSARQRAREHPGARRPDRHQHGQPGAQRDHSAARGGEEQRERRRRQRRHRERAATARGRMSAQPYEQRAGHGHAGREPVPVVERVAQPRPHGRQQRVELLLGEPRRLDAAAEREPGDGDEAGREPREPQARATGGRRDHDEHEDAQVARRPDRLGEGRSVVARPAGRERGEQREREQRGAACDRGPGDAGTGPEPEAEPDGHRAPHHQRRGGAELLRVAAAGRRC